MGRAAGPHGAALGLSAPRAPRDAGPLAAFSAEQLDGLSRALAAVTLAVPAPQQAVPPAVPPPRDPPPRDPPPSREDLMGPLALALSRKHPLRLAASARGGTLLLEARGRAHDETAEAEADALLREHVLPLLPEPSADGPPVDAVRLVLDLRALAAFPRAAAVVLLERWGAFVACRCFSGRLAVVMPQAPQCAAELRAAAEQTRLAEAFAPLRCAVLARARDVAPIMDRETITAPR